MKNKNLLFLIAAALVALAFPKSVAAQAPQLGAAASFCLFTAAGAVGNTGISNIKGNVGSNVGAITGFGAPSTMTGNIYSGDALTAQSSIDLIAAYAQLYAAVPTSSAHTPAFGGGETLFPGVYSIAAAGSVAGDLFLDAQGDVNAVFIFKFGGAFTTGASSAIILLNGASACNVFWGAEGAIAMAAGTLMSGTLIANKGAISMGAGGVLDGRMLSTTGAASVYGVSMPISSCFALPVETLSFTAVCDNGDVALAWSTATEANNSFFTVEKSSDAVNWQAAATVRGAGNSSLIKKYSFTDLAPSTTTGYYRLKQTDLDGDYKYGAVLRVSACGRAPRETLALYPNPSTGIFRILFAGDMAKVLSTEISDSWGRKVYGSASFQPELDLSSKSPGVYFVKILLYSESLTVKAIVTK